MVLFTKYLQEISAVGHYLCNSRINLEPCFGLFGLLNIYSIVQESNLTDLTLGRKAAIIYAGW
ncbi:MAG: hypothetical protein FWG70_09980 [Oscillospiraceae bacterium]|nr:hypothetical protein [Oscillospiraceae bacterium]